jgi:hypothetical protein
MSASVLTASMRTKTTSRMMRRRANEEGKAYSALQRAGAD